MRTLSYSAQGEDGSEQQCDLLHYRFVVVCRSGGRFNLQSGILSPSQASAL